MEESEGKLKGMGCKHISLFLNYWSKKSDKELYGVSRTCSLGWPQVAGYRDVLDMFFREQILISRIYLSCELVSSLEVRRQLKRGRSNSSSHFHKVALPRENRLRKWKELLDIEWSGTRA
ncbi:uncharacterized protein [Lolium perenne]|uniref:uncharacterized protein n=1 Tax=Lolium perenne TaxID=4522 RepID=UPI0021F5844D|nr:uncharacterized protein LOC127307091 [Lolium perenne]